MALADSGGCKFNLDMMRYICEQLGVPLAANKCVGPARHREKLEQTRMEITRWWEELEGCHFRVSGSSGKGTKKRWWTCTKRQLSSLAGLLQHASVVVRPGCTFLRRIYDKRYNSNHHLSY